MRAGAGVIVRARTLVHAQHFLFLFQKQIGKNRIKWKM